MSRVDRSIWLADPSQPAARYRYLVRIQGVSPESREARAAHREIPRRGWSRRIFRGQDPRGFWMHRKSLYRPKYAATSWRLLVLSDLGLTIRDPRIRRAVDLILHEDGWSDGPFRGRNEDTPHFCFVGNTARMMILFGLGDDRRVRKSLEWLADEQLEDGGWDCFGRPHGTLDCWEALSAFATLGRRGWTRKWKLAVERGAEFFLDRGLPREGRRRYPPWERLHYPVHYYYDVLVGLETLCRLGYGDDPRLDPAKDILMVLFLALPQPVNPWTNIVVALGFFGFNLVGLPTYPSLDDRFPIIVGLRIKVLTAWYAWTWGWGMTPEAKLDDRRSWPGDTA